MVAHLHSMDKVKVLATKSQKLEWLGYLRGTQDCILSKAVRVKLSWLWSGQFSQFLSVTWVSLDLMICVL